MADLSSTEKNWLRHNNGLLARTDRLAIARPSNKGGLGRIIVPIVVLILVAAATLLGMR